MNKQLACVLTGRSLVYQLSQNNFTFGATLLKVADY